ncbi:hypothetical protein FIBSPDRAFT_731435, partial [Athelia psychrophila]
MSDTPAIPPPPLLQILNINVNKLLAAQTDILNRTNPADWDILCIQEPCFDFRDTTRGTLKWTMVYPRKHNNKVKRTRALMLVNVKLPTTSWKELPVDLVDVAGIQMTGNYGALRIYSIY